MPHLSFLPSMLQAHQHQLPPRFFWASGVARTSQGHSRALATFLVPSGGLRATLSFWNSEFSPTALRPGCTAEFTSYSVEWKHASPDLSFLFPTPHRLPQSLSVLTPPALVEKLYFCPKPDTYCISSILRWAFFVTHLNIEIGMGVGQEQSWHHWR